MPHTVSIIFRAFKRGADATPRLGPKDQRSRIHHSLGQPLHGANSSWEDSYIRGVRSNVIRMVQTYYSLTVDGRSSPSPI